MLIHIALFFLKVQSPQALCAPCLDNETRPGEPYIMLGFSSIFALGGGNIRISHPEDMRSVAHGWYVLSFVALLLGLPKRRCNCLVA
jgi:hypothetical protein